MLYTQAHNQVSINQSVDNKSFTSLVLLNINHVIGITRAPFIGLGITPENKSNAVLTSEMYVEVLPKHVVVLITNKVQVWILNLVL